MTAQDVGAVSLVIPVYNSASCLPKLVEALREPLSRLGRSFEVILVNDGSSDDSWPMIMQLSRDYSWIRGICLMRNYGQHNALLCGIAEATGDVIVTMDDDLQNPPEEIPKLLDKIDEGMDVVYGTPRIARHGFLRNLASQVTKLVLQNTMGADTARSVSSFRAFRSQVRTAFDSYRDPFVNVDVLLTWGAARFASVPVDHRARADGTTNYSLAKLVAHALNMMTGFSALPLRLASMVGFAFTLFGMGTLTFVVGRFLIQGSPVPGFPFLASTIAIFSGAQLFALGVIGEYLARIHFRMMERPPFAVRARTPDDVRT